MNNQLEPPAWSLKYDVFRPGSLVQFKSNWHFHALGSTRVSRPTSSVKVLSNVVGMILCCVASDDDDECVIVGINSSKHGLIQTAVERLTIENYGDIAISLLKKTTT